MAMSDLLETVSERNHLPLLGQTDAAVMGFRWHRENGMARPAAAPANCAAPAVKEPKSYAGVDAYSAKPLLSLVQRPVRHPVAAVLVTVGIAEHDLLKPAACFK